MFLFHGKFTAKHLYSRSLPSGKDLTTLNQESKKEGRERVAEFNNHEEEKEEAGDERMGRTAPKGDFDLWRGGRQPEDRPRLHKNLATLPIERSEHRHSQSVCLYA